MEILIQPNGVVRCIYDEAINLSALGRVQINRGSHVEPDEGGRWFADLAVVQGPCLGPFDRRSDALDAERRWLSENWLHLFAREFLPIGKNSHPDSQSRTSCLGLGHGKFHYRQSRHSCPDITATDRPQVIMSASISSKPSRLPGWIGADVPAIGWQP